MNDFRKFSEELWGYYKTKSDPKNTANIVEKLGGVVKSRGLHHEGRVDWQGAYNDILEDHTQNFGFPDVSLIMRHINFNKKHDNRVTYNTLAGQDIDGYYRCSGCRGKGGTLLERKSKATKQTYTACELCEKCHGAGYDSENKDNEFVRFEDSSFDQMLESVKDTEPEAYAFIKAIRGLKK